MSARLPSISFSGISSEWQDWISLNLARGCAPEALIDILVANHFEPALSARTVAEIVRRGAARSGRAPEHSRIAQRNRIVLADRVVHVAARMARPEIVLLADLLTHEECGELISLSREKLARSTVVNPATGAEDVIAARSSLGAYFSIGENPLVSRLDRLVADLTGIPEENGEGLQVLSYLPGAEYQPHFDYFPESDPGSAAHLARGGQRIATFVMYLNDVEEGGETYFPAAGQFMALPRRGSAVYFAYCDAQGRVDPATLHGGAPVRAGEKWIAVKWLRQGAYR